MTNHVSVACILTATTYCCNSTRGTIYLEWHPALGALITTKSGSERKQVSKAEWLSVNDWVKRNVVNGEVKKDWMP